MWKCLLPGKGEFTECGNVCCMEKESSQKCSQCVKYVSPQNMTMFVMFAAWSKRVHRMLKCLSC